MKELNVSTYSLEQLLKSSNSVLSDLANSLNGLLGVIPKEPVDHEVYFGLYLEALVAAGSVGVWDSNSHGRIIWLCIKTALPLYVPMLIVLEGRRAREIEPHAYRAILLDLNNALLQSEGFE